MYSIKVHIINVFLYVIKISFLYSNVSLHVQGAAAIHELFRTFFEKEVEDKCFSYLNIQLGLLFFDHFLKSRMDGLAGTDYIVP